MEKHELLCWSDDKIEDLIEIVKKNEYLYNPKHKDYKNHAISEKTWSKIDVLLRKPPGVSKDQWQKLRTYFRTKTKSKKAGSSKWKFYDRLKFLEPFVKSSNPENSLSKFIARIKDEYDDIEMESKDTSIIDNFIEEEDPLIEDGDAETEQNPVDFYYLTESSNSTYELVYKDDSNNVNDSEIKKTTLQNESIPIYQAENCENLLTHAEHPTNDISLPLITQTITEEINKQNLENPLCICQNDPNAIFLRSLLTDLKLMSHKDRGIFKIKVQQLIQDILYPDE